VKNTGARDGDEVVQVYATAVNPPVPMPLRQLVGFQRVSLKSGETKAVEIKLPVKQLRRWDETSNRYVVDSGSWHLDAGPASDVLPLRTVLNIARE
jgi:beta-glucosidase